MRNDGKKDGDPKMKITKAQIQKIIKEELDAIEEDHGERGSLDPAFVAADKTFSVPDGADLKSEDFMNKLKGMFGLEEDATLTTEELQQIVQEEIQNITKGN